MQVNFKKYLILNHLIKFCIPIILKRNCRKYLQKTMVSLKKNKCINKMKIFNKIKFWMDSLTPQSKREARKIKIT